MFVLIAFAFLIVTARDIEIERTGIPLIPRNDLGEMNNEGFFRKTGFCDVA